MAAAPLLKSAATTTAVTAAAAATANAEEKETPLWSASVGVDKVWQVVDEQSGVATPPPLQQPPSPTSSPGALFHQSRQLIVKHLPRDVTEQVGRCWSLHFASHWSHRYTRRPILAPSRPANVDALAGIPDARPCSGILAPLDATAGRADAENPWHLTVLDLGDTARPPGGAAARAMLGTLGMPGIVWGGGCCADVSVDAPVSSHVLDAKQ